MFFAGRIKASPPVPDISFIKRFTRNASRSARESTKIKSLSRSAGVNAHSAGRRADPMHFSLRPSRSAAASVRPSMSVEAVAVRGKPRPKSLHAGIELSLLSPSRADDANPGNTPRDAPGGMRAPRLSSEPRWMWHPALRTNSSVKRFIRSNDRRVSSNDPPAGPLPTVFEARYPEESIGYARQCPPSNANHPIGGQTNKRRQPSRRLKIGRRTMSDAASCWHLSTTRFRGQPQTRARKGLRSGIR
jgi:hypothetical protein